MISKKWEERRTGFATAQFHILLPRAPTSPKTPQPSWEVQQGISDRSVCLLFALLTFFIHFALFILELPDYCQRALS